MDAFHFAGEPIADPHAWAKARGEQMVQYALVFILYDKTNERELRHIVEGEMPASFYEALCAKKSAFQYFSYHEVERRDP